MARAVGVHNHFIAIFFGSCGVQISNLMIANTVCVLLDCLFFGLGVSGLKFLVTSAFSGLVWDESYILNFAVVAYFCDLAWFVVRIWKKNFEVGYKR